MNVIREDQFNQVDQQVLQSVLSAITEKSKRITIETLHKDPQLRKKNEIQQLIDNTSSYPFFDSYIQAGQSDIHAQCCKRMRLEVQHKDQTVFEVGEFGQYFYLILHGSVSVSIKIPGWQCHIQYKGKIDGSDANLENIINSIDQVSASKTKSNTTPSLRLAVDNLLQVSVLREGFQFGEMALLNNQPRLATIKCLEDCVFAILGKKDFKQILKQNEEEKLYKEMCYFSSLPFLVQWNINMLKNLFLNSRKKQYLRDQYLFQEGDSTDSVYIIKKGDFELSKKFCRLEDIDGLNLDANEIKVFDENEHLSKFEPHKKDMKICILDEHTIIGEEDIIKDNPKRTFSVKCTSLFGLAIRIDKNEFQFRVMLEESSKICILKQLEIKDKAFNLRMKDIQGNLQQFQNYFYQNSKHKEYIRSKIESQSSKLFQSNSLKKSTKGLIKSNQEDSQNKKYGNSPLTNKDQTTKTSVATKVNSFAEAVVNTTSSFKRMHRSQSSYLNTNQSIPPSSEPVENYKRNFMNLQQSNTLDQNTICDSEQLYTSIQTKPASHETNQDYSQTRHPSLNNQRFDKKVRSISSNDQNLFTILKMSLQDQKKRHYSKELTDSKEYNFIQRPQIVEEQERPRLLYGNIEQSIKQNFKKVFQKKLREKGSNTEIKEIPTWNKVSMSFANQVLTYHSDPLLRQRATSAKRKIEYDSLIGNTHEFSQDHQTIQVEKNQDKPMSLALDTKIKRKSIRSSSNTKTLIKVMRNFQSSQLNCEQSKLVDCNSNNDTKKESYLRSLDFNSISNIQFSPKKNSSRYKSTLRIKKQI